MHLWNFLSLPFIITFFLSFISFIFSFNFFPCQFLYNYNFFILFIFVPKQRGSVAWSEMAMSAKGNKKSHIVILNAFSLFPRLDMDVMRRRMNYNCPTDHFFIYLQSGFFMYIFLLFILISLTLNSFIPLNSE